MRDLFGKEVTMEQALALKRKTPPTDRRTLIVLRQQRGLHPHNGMPLREPAGETCGSCRKCVRHDYHTRVYYKCAYTKATHGAGTDIRVRWPACERWVARDAK